MKEYPTLWQRKMMWAALTACFVVILVVIVAAVIWAAASIVSFLQPILIPVAIAAILPYLLDPLVTKMSRGTLTHWHRFDNVRAELCSSHRRDGGRAHDDSLYRNHHLLGAGCSYRSISMG